MWCAYTLMLLNVCTKPDTISAWNTQCTIIIQYSICVTWQYIYIFKMEQILSTVAFIGIKIVIWESLWWVQFIVVNTHTVAIYWVSSVFYHNHIETQTNYTNSQCSSMCTIVNGKWCNIKRHASIWLLTIRRYLQQRKCLYSLYYYC